MRSPASNGVVSTGSQLISFLKSVIFVPARFAD